MAANTRDIRRRIKSVKNTAQITKAMQMVAASKMRKAQQHALETRPYGFLLHKMSLALRELTDGETHPLLQIRPVKKQLIVLISTDKGLCGALNTNLFREAAKFDPAQTVFVTAGRKAAQWVARNRRELLADFPLKDTPAFADAKAISKFVIEKFLTGDIDQVDVIYTSFVNTLSQTPVVATLLPITPSAHELSHLGEVPPAGQILFEPDAPAFLDALMPYYVHFIIFRKILEARASEHSARMVAMKSATDNAKSLIKDLTLEYNKIRQAGITTELLEISTAQMVLS